MIGILALQGAISEHQKILELLGQRVVLIKKPSQLAAVDGLIIPGGESTTFSLLIEKYGLKKPLSDFVANKPVLATCAGLIILAREVKGGKVCMPLLNITIQRNAFGRQVDSFEEELPVPILGEKRYPAIFIRAPLIQKTGKNIDILAKYNQEVVAIKQDKIIGLAFHPELTNDTRFHQLFISMVNGQRSTVNGQRTSIRQS